MSETSFGATATSSQLMRCIENTYMTGSADVRLAAGTFENAMNSVTTACALGRIQKCDKGGERVTHLTPAMHRYIVTRRRDLCNQAADTAPNRSLEVKEKPK